MCVCVCGSDLNCIFTFLSHARLCSIFSYYLSHFSLIKLIIYSTDLLCVPCLLNHVFVMFFGYNVMVCFV